MTAASEVQGGSLRSRQTERDRKRQRARGGEGDLAQHDSKLGLPTLKQHNKGLVI